MIPLRATVPTQRFPLVTYALIGANVSLFAYEITLVGRLQSFWLVYGWVPANFSQALTDGQIPALVPLFTNMFLHGSWLHLFGNLLYLHIFGGNVEDRLGHLRYLCFYCLGGIVAIFVQTYAAPLSATPMIGASGAIAAVVGAYCVFYPTSRVLTLVPLFRVVPVPTVWYVLLWLMFQLLSGVSLLSPEKSALAGAAWWAHAGGFVAGLVLGPLFLMRRKRRFRHVPLPLPPLWNSPKSALR
ncbi:MAG TPA: rhomboid family intramembrane serine protease [Candidatus Binatia bacterium]|jgi:membrane associated rhomboid family serine protease|nr:rhomboid family intramembrane serine protease [Candidatus Binatia bacterium]